VSSKKSIQQVSKFLIAGGSVYLLRLISIYIFVDFLKLPFSPVYLVTLLTIFVIGFFLNFKFVFSNKSNLKKKLFLFLATNLILNGLDYLLVDYLSQLLKFEKYLSIVVVSIVIFIIKFAALKYLVFTENLSKKST
jgi:putative flippase GtrA